MSSSRVNCSECGKDYANRKSLKKHLVGVHKAKFNYRSDTIRVLQGTELQTAEKALRRRQQNKKNKKNKKASVSDDKKILPVRTRPPPRRSPRHSTHVPSPACSSASGAMNRVKVIPAPFRWDTVSPVMPDI